jgi:hypothetical protein
MQSWFSMYCVAEPETADMLPQLAQLPPLAQAAWGVRYASSDEELPRRPESRGPSGTFVLRMRDKTPQYRQL